MQCLLRKRFFLILRKICHVTICASSLLLYDLAPMGLVWLTAPPPLFSYSFLPGSWWFLWLRQHPAFEGSGKTTIWRGNAGHGGATQPYGFVSCFHCWISFETKFLGAQCRTCVNTKEEFFPPPCAQAHFEFSMSGEGRIMCWDTNRIICGDTCLFHEL